MNDPAPKTLIFCTAYTHPAAGPFYAWDRRYRTWLDGIRNTQLHYDQILLVDDGSPSLPDWPDLVILQDGVDLRTDAPLVLYHFTEHLGRVSVSDFPGWTRSFFFAAAFAKANGFDKVIHLEADALLISPRVHEYVNNIRDDWVSFYCALFDRPESGIQIMAGGGLTAYLDYASQPIDVLRDKVVEGTLPFTHVETGFTGDRYGEYLDHVPMQAEWCMQAVPKGSVAPAAYFWWLPTRSSLREARDFVCPMSAGSEIPPVHSGIWYQDLFRRLDATLRPRRYLEIGTGTGDSLRCFSCDAICVDSVFAVKPEAIGARQRTFLFHGTSDAFFESGDLSRVFPQGFDVAFLDGLHHAEVLLRDFINAERCSHPNSVIILHDCLPLNERMAEREWRRDEAADERTRDFWTGDVWKVCVALKLYRPDLKLYFIDCASSGLLICLNPDRNSDVLAATYQQITAWFDTLRLADYGLDALWRLLPTLDSRRLMDEADGLRAVFGQRWSAEPPASSV